MGLSCHQARCLASAFPSEGLKAGNGAEIININLLIWRQLIHALFHPQSPLP
jgi:hypothetical protein